MYLGIGKYSLIEGPRLTIVGVASTAASVAARYGLGLALGPAAGIGLAVAALGVKFYSGIAKVQ